MGMWNPFVLGLRLEWGGGSGVVVSALDFRSEGYPPPPRIASVCTRGGGGRGADF